ncbi:MAG: rRNA maturation RNase YbeY [Pseudomonadota bacterium]
MQQLTNDIDILIEDARWQAAGLETLAMRAVTATLDQCGIPFADLSLLACDDARIATLNAEFRQKPTPTNVLSWPEEDLASQEPGGAPNAPTPGPDGTISLGDIAITYDTCAREAREQGKPMADHVAHLLVHGTLHLLGYDHIRDGDAARMEALEVKILGKMGIPDPY